jgi:hypothetical protein
VWTSLILTDFQRVPQKIYLCGIRAQMNRWRCHMSEFADRFGGTSIQPSDVAYREFSSDENQYTQWPPYATKDNVLAKVMNFIPLATNLVVYLPDAREASPGESIVFMNDSEFAYLVSTNTGDPVVSVSPGGRRLILVSDNTTQSGEWQSILLGVGTGVLDIAGAAGAGLRAVGTQLDVAFPVVTIPIPITLAEVHRDNVLVWTGGTGTFNLPNASTLVDFNCEIRNQGTGALTLLPSGGQLIDGVSSIVLNVDESLWLHSASSSSFWTTVGRGRNTNFAFTQLQKTVTGGTVVLTLTEAANVVQNYNGVLTSNCDVVLPSIVQVYFVTNQTSGAFNLRFKNAGAGTTVTLPTLQSAILFSDGINVTNAATTTSGVQQVAYGAGTATAPSVSINGTNNGFFSPSSGQVSFSSSGTEVVKMTGTGLQAVATANPNISVKGVTGNASLEIQRPSGATGFLQYSTNTSPRWLVYASSAPESGANAGTDFQINRYDDAGALLGTPLSINRASGEVTLNAPLRQKALVGEIKYFVGGAIARSGFLFCDGSLISRATYADLWAYAQAVGATDETTWAGGYFGYFSTGNGSTTFRIPDLRGLFLRGLDNGRGLDPSRPWGYYQDQQNMWHAHSISDPSHVHTVNDPSHVHGVADGGHAHGVSDPTHAHSGWTGDAGWHGHGVSDPGHAHGYTGKSGGTFAAGVNWSEANNAGMTTAGSGTGIGIQANGTHQHGVGIGGAATNIGIYGAGTGIGIYGAGTGVYLSYAGTGITVAGAGGENHPRNMAYPIYIRY